ncbi:MAG: glycosyltransferase, partial [Muribaculaceae bacterium]|nr:glycosyltransferase [Muribaculaceae bacterium]
MISIIVPVYNVEEFLPRCVESVIAQSYPDWELILVDDGSLDGSPEICDSYADKDSRIKVIHKSNGGVSEARNVGIRAATGEWICFIDSDDYVAPRYLEAMLSKSGDADIVISGWEYAGLRKSFPEMDVYRLDFLKIMEQKAFINICGKLIRHNSIARAAALFETDVKWAEDSIFFLKVLLSCDKVRLISDVNYFYEYREGSAVSRINSYECELAAFNAVNALMPELIRVCSSKSREYFGPYLFLLRTYQA